MTAISFDRAADYYDATRGLPADAQAAVAPAWQQAVDEALRMLRPGGVLLVDFSGGTPAPWSDSAAQIAARHGVRAVRPGVSDPDVVAAYLAGRARLRALPGVALKVTRTLARELDEWERQLFSWTWPYSPAQLKVVCDEVRKWAVGQGRRLDRPIELERTIRWLAYDVTS